MRFIADFHIHSHYSIATSSQLVVPFLDLWGRKKGINVIGTGDAVHPGYFNELKENLVSSDNGLYKVKKKKVTSRSHKVYFQRNFVCPDN